jgi:transglutaminase-like putative cysteine protease
MKPSRTRLWTSLCAAALFGCDAPPASPPLPPQTVQAPAVAPSPAAPPVATKPVPAATSPSPASVAAAPAPKQAPPKAAAAPAKPAVVSDQWYRSLQDGQPRGWKHVKWTRSTWKGKPTIHDHTEDYSSTTRRMASISHSFESHTYTDVERSEEDGLLYELKLRDVQNTENGDRESDEIRTWTGSGYESTSHTTGMEEKHAFACEAPSPSDAEAYLASRIAAQQVAVGAKFEYKVVNLRAERLDTVHLDVEARETVTAPAGKFDCFRVKQTVSGAPASDLFWLDARTGVFRRIVGGRDEWISATEAQAKDVREGGAVFSITLRADPNMPRATSLDKAVVDVTIAPKPGLELPDFPATPFSRELSRKDNVIRLELTAHDEPADAIELPVKAPEFQKHLERTNMFCTDAAIVKAALKQAVGDEKDAREIVKKILRYVFVAVEKGEQPLMGANAAEILEMKSGCCTECCTVFITLCRAAGIPARRLSGYAQVGDMWGGHSFAEVWLGRWIGCDPTTADFGTKARYICFGWVDDPDSFPGVVSDRAMGRMAIRTVEFTEGARTWKTAEARRAGGGREDVLGGISFAEPPAGWTVHTGPMTGQGRVTGPGVHASCIVHAGYGDLPCEVLGRNVRGAKIVKFGGVDALCVTESGGGSVHLTVPYKRRMMRVEIRVDDATKAMQATEAVAKLLAPSFQ